MLSLVLVALLARSGLAAPFVFTPIDVPGSRGTSAQDINNAGTIVGVFSASLPAPVRQGFLLNGSAFTTINVPDALRTAPTNINGRGDVVGFFRDATGTDRGFLFSGGTFTPIEQAGASATFANGINDNGQIVGQFVQLAPAADRHQDAGGTFLLEARLNEAASRQTLSRVRWRQCV